MLSVNREDGTDAVGCGICWDDGQKLEQGWAGKHMMQSVVHGEQPDVSLAISLDINNILGRLVVYTIIIGETSLDVVGVEDAIAIS